MAIASCWSYGWDSAYSFSCGTEQGVFQGTQQLPLGWLISIQILSCLEFPHYFHRSVYTFTGLFTQHTSLSFHKYNPHFLSRPSIQVNSSAMHKCRCRRDGKPRGAVGASLQGRAWPPACGAGAAPATNGKQGCSGKVRVGSRAWLQSPGEAPFVVRFLQHRQTEVARALHKLLWMGPGWSLPTALGEHNGFSGFPAALQLRHLPGNAAHSDALGCTCEFS